MRCWMKLVETRNGLTPPGSTSDYKTGYRQGYLEALSFAIELMEEEAWEDGIDLDS
jgi:hypothetical protein